MQINTTPISELLVVQCTPHIDTRGAFTRFYCEDELQSVIGQRRILQINHSRTATVGAVRGLHFQHLPHAEMKLVRCLKGRIWDVAVDLRRDSSTFLHWYAEELTPANERMMVIPEGFAHGFQVIEPESELLYLHTAFYSPSSEDGLRYDDPSLGIKWPLAVTDLSKRDHSHASINTNFKGIAI
jgi:dTDP-4-dehydrorhamnose 3,5-epimerase